MIRNCTRAIKHFEFEFEYIATMTMIIMAGAKGAIIFQRILFDYTPGNNFRIVITHLYAYCISNALNGRSH